MAVDLSAIVSSRLWQRLHEEDGLRWALLVVAPPKRGCHSTRIVVRAFGDAPLDTVRGLIRPGEVSFIFVRADGVDAGAPRRVKLMVASFISSTVPFKQRVCFGEASAAVVSQITTHPAARRV